MTDEQKAFLMVLLRQFKAGCPHYGEETSGHQAMVDDLIANKGSVSMETVTTTPYLGPKGDLK
jgi:hypothetical protein